MALTFSLVDTWDDGKRIHVAGTAAASGNYTTTGDTLDLSQFPIIAATQAPVQGTAWMDGLAGLRLRFLSRLGHEQRQSQNLPAGRKRGRVPRARRRRLPLRHHRRHHHLLRYLQEAAVSRRAGATHTISRDGSSSYGRRYIVPGGPAPHQIASGFASQRSTLASSKRRQSVATVCRPGLHGTHVPK